MHNVHTMRAHHSESIAHMRVIARYAGTCRLSRRWIRIKINWKRRDADASTRIYSYKRIYIYTYIGINVCMYVRMQLIDIFSRNQNACDARSLLRAVVAAPAEGGE